MRRRAQWSSARFREPSLAIRERVSTQDIEAWWVQAFHELREAVRKSGLERTGKDAALYASELFELEVGEVVAFVPVAGEARAVGRIQPDEVPAAALAVLPHEGPFS